jgi:hypothetical protein
MVEVAENCPPGVYIIQTPCSHTVTATRRYLLARIPDTYFTVDGRAALREGFVQGQLTVQITLSM